MLNRSYLTLGGQKPSSLPVSGYTGWSMGVCSVGGQESLLKELAGLFLGFGDGSSVALWASLPPTHYSFTVRKSWSNRHQEEKGRGRGGERRDFYLLDKMQGRSRDLSSSLT